MVTPQPSRRRLLGAGLAVSLAAPATLAACGPGGAGVTGDGAGRSAASGTVRYYNWGNAFSDSIEQKVIDAFHAKNEKIKIEFTNSTPGEGSHFTKLTALLAA